MEWILIVLIGLAILYVLVSRKSRKELENDGKLERMEVERSERLQERMAADGDEEAKLMSFYQDEPNVKPLFPDEKPKRKGGRPRKVA